MAEDYSKMEPQVKKTLDVQDSVVTAAHQRVVDQINRNDSMTVTDLSILERAAIAEHDGKEEHIGKALGIGVYAESTLTSIVTGDPKTRDQVNDFAVAQRTRINLLRDEEDRVTPEQIRDDVEHRGVMVIEALGAYKARVPEFADVMDGPTQIMEERFKEARAQAARHRMLEQGQKRAAGQRTGGGGADFH